MRLLLCIFLPWLGFFTIGQPCKGVLCLILQLLILSWPIAAIWAVYSLSQYENAKRLDAALARYRR